MTSAAFGEVADRRQWGGGTIKQRDEDFDEVLMNIL